MPSNADHQPALVRLLVLGPCTVEADGERIALSSVQRRILCCLALRGRSLVEPDELADAVWSGQPPATARAALQNQVSRIRRRLGTSAILTEDGRYRLGIPTDADAAASGLDAGERALAAAPARAFDTADAALALWRGTPFEDIDRDDVVTDAVRRQIAETRYSLETLRLEAAMASARSSWVIPEAERLVGTTPHDEHRWALLIQALDAGGRRGDALGAADRARRTLATNLGLQPGPQILAAEAAVLRGGDTSAVASTGSVLGRDDSIGVIAAAAREESALLLVGEPGIGKTRFLDAVARRARSDGSLVGTAAFTLHPASATTTLADLLDDLGATLDARRPPVEAFADALAALASPDRPVLLCVDDIDRAGPTSVAALGAAAGRPDVAVIATTASADAWPAAVRHDVEPLRPEAVALLTERLDGVAPDAERLRWLMSMSGGNPTMVEYLLAGPTTSDAGLRGLVRSRTELLDRPTRWALEIAAVCGPRFPAPLLGSLAPANGISTAIAEGLLVELADPEVRVLGFRHEAVQAILYEELAPGRRAEIHHAASAVLVDLDTPAAQVAVHAIAAAELDRSTAIEWAMAAASDAIDVGGFAEAATWFGRAAGAAEGFDEHHSDRVAAVIGRGDALRCSGSPEQEEALFAAADAAIELGDPDLIADAAFAVLQLGATTGSGSLHERGISLAETALEVTRDTDRRALVAGAASLAHSMSGDSDRCAELFRSSIEWAESPATRRAVLPFAYLGLGHPRDLDERDRLAQELLGLGTDVDDPVSMYEAHQLIASVAMQRGDGAGLRQAVTSMEELVERVGDVGRRWALLFLRAALAHLDGRLDDAESISAAAMELFAEVSASRALAVHGGQLLVIRLAQGRVGELTEVLESLVEDQPGVPAWNAALALALSATGDARAATFAAAALEDVAEDFTWLAAHVVGGRAAAACGDTTLAERYVERLAPWSGRLCWQGSCCYGPVDTVLAMLATATADAERAAAHAELALDRSRSLGAAVFEDEASELLGRLAPATP